MALDTALRTEFLDLLERDAAFREAVRRQLLTPELIELPERFAAFVTRVDGFIARTEEFMVRTEEFMVEQKAINARVTERLDGVDRRFDGVDCRLQAITDDLGVLKAMRPGAPRATTSRRSWIGWGWPTSRSSTGATWWICCADSQTSRPANGRASTGPT